LGTGAKNGKGGVGGGGGKGLGGGRESEKQKKKDLGVVGAGWCLLDSEEEEDVLSEDDVAGRESR